MTTLRCEPPRDVTHSAPNSPLRPGLIPRDLQEVEEAADRRLDALDTAEIRYALRFLEEATTNQIRVSRIDAIVRALPPRKEKGV